MECEDNQGNRSFQTSCPPDSKIVNQKKINTGNTSAKSTAKSDIEILLYAIPECAGCDEIRELLSSRNISYTEKNVDNNIELQKELTELTGELRVPTTVIGDKVLTGYGRSELLNTLKDTGLIVEEETKS